MRVLICEDSVLLREGLVRLLDDAEDAVAEPVVPPIPSSSMRAHRMFPSRCRTSTRHCAARECFAALVSASAMTK